MSENDRPLFIPLKAEHYDAFARGEKTEEYRLRGKRWNMETCRLGRRVILSRGYGNQHRLTGVITGCHYATLPARLPGWLDCYGPGAGDATVIQIQIQHQAQRACARNSMKNTETQSQASLPRLVRNWSDLAMLPESETHRLEIDVANCNGWIIEKMPIKGYNYYLSTHTFYGGKHEYSTRLLQECGWNVICANWDIPNGRGERPGPNDA